MYGVYKRATLGPPDANARPSYFAFSARAKYDAWEATGSITREAAMRLYVTLVVDGSGDADADDEPFARAVSKMEKEAPDTSDSSIVFEYAKKDMIERLKTALTECPRLVDARDACGMTPLFFACDRGHAGIVRYLLDSGADINVQDSIGQTCLHVAASSGREALYALLVESGGDEDIRDEDAATPRDLW